MADYVKALEDVAELLYPATGELPYEVRQFSSAPEALVWFDDAVRLRKLGFSRLPEKPLLAVLDRGSSREPVVMVHGYEALRLLRDADWG